MVEQPGALDKIIGKTYISIGPVMWVPLSKMFPNRIRGLAISFVGLINSAVSFGVVVSATKGKSLEELEAQLVVDPR